MTVFAVAALSARVLAEAARADGFEVAALDVFGDVDTRRACSQWIAVGRPNELYIDEALLLAALSKLALHDGVSGWIAGSGFEGRPNLLERGAALLPLIGTPPGAVRKVRDPGAFFGFLDAAGIAHPPVQMTPPADVTGWLVKDFGGSGGWHIRRAAPRPEPLPAQGYFQCEMAGTPMSASFIANGSDAVVLGFNRLIVRRFGARPFVYCGAMGPLALPGDLGGRVTAAVRALAAEFALRGLASLDFMLDGEAFDALEVNPRPPASMALYPRVVAAHVKACLQGELPPAWPAVDTLRGTEIVFATRPLHLAETAAQGLAERAACHDLPSGATRFEAGDPVCSVSASGADADEVLALLARRREAVELFLENPA